MRVERIALEDFRNYRRAEIELSDGLNLVIGRNGQGKTNLLEAVYCLSGLGSPRGSDGELIREGAERALLHATVQRGARNLMVDLEISPGRSRGLINKTPTPGLRALAEVVGAVFFGPDDLSLVKGAPEGRRRFLDDLGVKTRPARAGLRREWDRTLRQRNALLRSAPRTLRGGSSKTLEVWDQALVRTGAAVTAARLETLATLFPRANERFGAVAGGGRLELDYSSSWVGPDEWPEARTTGRANEGRLRDDLAHAVEDARARELERGLSLVGPQRDDVVVRLTSSSHEDDLLDARSFASQGEQRTAVLGLKLGELEVLRTALREEPILLLDDVFSELDPHRRVWLGQALGAGGQTLLSSAEPGAAEAAAPAATFEVEAGEVSKRG